MSIDLNNALNIMYANENRKLLTIEPNTKEYEYYQGRVNAYEEIKDRKGYVNDKGIFVKEQMIDTQLAKRGTEIC